MATPQRLGEVFVEVADTLVADFDIVEFLTTLAHRTAELLGAAEAGVVLADTSGTLRSVASSSDAARVLDLFEIQNEEGPCLDCFRSGVPIVNHSLDGDSGHWPSFTREATRLGYHVVHALPMRLRGQVIGAINLFATDDARFDDSQIALAQALADVATIAILQERSLREARVLSEQLQSALQSRVLIEQAKGMLSERRGIDLDRAFELLRSHARRSNRRLSEVALALVNDELPDDWSDGL